MSCPRIVLAGLSGDTGKTAISVGLCRAWQQKNYKVVPFKKGPDYIDMGWLSLGANHPCYNLDLFFMTKEQIIFSFCLHTKYADIAVIEGNRGLFDGLDVEGTVSTAELAKLLNAPVILIVDCTKVTRTIAALVLGCQHFDPKVSIKGVILNKLAHARHENIIKASIEKYCKLPILGAIPRLENITFPDRHLGLVPPQEHPKAEEAIQSVAEIVKKYLDIETIWQIANQTPSLSFIEKNIPSLIKGINIKIGVIKDAAFHFYYPENLEVLKKAGAEIIEFSALKDTLPDDLDALYIGGGFPETHAEMLSSNLSLRHAIKEAAEAGLPIYAECGGLMYLSEKLIWQEKTYPMVGILPIILGVSKKPKGHGYTIIEVISKNPFFKTGHILKGHEFHYSYVIKWTQKKGYFAFSVKKGYGIDGKHDGFCYKNVLAAYTHLHALGTEEWAKNFIKQAINYHFKKSKNLSQ